MEGLEIKEKDFSAAIENKDFRIDSQFYTKEPIKNPVLKYDKIGNHLIRAQYGISISMNEEGVGYPIYRMNEIHNMMCDTDVSKSADISKIELETFVLNERDVLFNRTNSFEWVGRTGLYKKTNTKDFVFASYLVRFIPNQETLLPEYLTTFLNSKYGVWDIKRRARQSINQTNVNPEEVKEIEFPLLSQSFQKLLKSCFDNAHCTNILSQSKYQQAENILLETLGLKDFEPSKEPVNIKSFNESFGSSGRLDAEYYQLKYEDYLELINSYSNGVEPLGQVCTIKDSNFNPLEKSEYKYIELANIGKSGEITGATCDFGSELPTRARRKINTNDVIISSIEGSLDSCALVNQEFDNSLCSTGFYVLTSSRLNPETLLVLFKSEPMQQLLKKGCSGTILTAIGKSELKKIPLPLIDDGLQKIIEDKIRQSADKRQESEQLLELAKTAVEKAIEENEEKAMEYVSTMIKKIEGLHDFSFNQATQENQGNHGLDN